MRSGIAQTIKVFSSSRYIKAHAVCLETASLSSTRNSKIQGFSPDLVTSISFLLPHQKMLDLSFPTDGAVAHRCRRSRKAYKSNGWKFLKRKVSPSPDSCLEESRLGEGCGEESPQPYICSLQNHLLILLILNLLKLVLPSPQPQYRQTWTALALPALCKLH